MRASTGAVNLELEDVQRRCGTTEGHVIDGNEVVFEVEFLCGKRVTKAGVTEYRVQWAGNYARKDKRSWEPIENIHEDWIATYEAELNGRSRKRTNKKRTPYTIQVAGNATAEEKERRADDADIIEEELARAGLQQLERQEGASKAPCLLF